MNERLIFNTSTELVRVLPASVVFISADGNYSAITMADGGEYVLTMQLGQIERHIAEMLKDTDTRFVRIGKSLIVNWEYISFIHPTRQKLVLSDGRTFRREVSASREALKALKGLIEMEAAK
ncbi:MAG: LytTR family transcriptional regulator [Bacteroides sp.]|nr:LytTR family transcriptional regulator [Bacteroides sp.]MCM1086033.1 LytTR family transcriptional regulator [Bacteroides sp.]